MHRSLVTLPTLMLPTLMYLASAFLALALPSVASAQIVTPPRFGSNLDVTRSRIGDERVSRQTEVNRLERLLEEMDARVIRLERQQLRSAQFPAITISEASACLKFAEVQLKETEYQFERGEASEVQVARDRLALVRAQGQLDSAEAAHEERLLTLEMDVVFAQRQLFQLRRERELAQKLAAKGYTSSDALQSLLLNEKLAEKELQLVQVRLQTQQKAAGQDGVPTPAEPDSTADKKEMEEGTGKTLPPD